MNANVTIKEPEIPDDPDTPFAFTMDGDQNVVPGPLVPRFWYPGWNSEQAINKFQIEVGDPLHGSDPGRRLIEPSGERTIPFCKAEQAPISAHKVWVVPKPCIFGSEELSALAPAVKELIPEPRLSIHPELALRLGVTEGDAVEIGAGGTILAGASGQPPLWARKLHAKLDDTLPDDVVSVPENLCETMGILCPAVSRIARSK